jgi:hypothetical protein
VLKGEDDQYQPARYQLLRSLNPPMAARLLRRTFTRASPGDPRIGVDWQVCCTQAWMDTEFRPTNLDNLAALGYFLWTQPTSKFTPQLLDGLRRMRERDRDRRLPKVLFILHTSNGFNNLGNLLFAQS